MIPEITNQGDDPNDFNSYDGEFITWHHDVSDPREYDQKYIHESELASLRSELERVKKERDVFERSEMYWITQFQKVTSYWYSKEDPNMEQGEFYAIKIRQSPKSLAEPPVK